MKRIEVTIWTDEVWLIRRASLPALSWCPQCAEAVNILSLDEAVVLSSISARTLFHWAEAGKVHYLETIEGFLLVCLKSLSRHFIADGRDVEGWEC